MDLELAGKRALIGGSTSGLGRAVAQALLREGCSVVIAGRDAGRVAKATTELNGMGCPHGARAHGVTVDLATPTGTLSLVEQGQAALGGVDILINNVGGPPPSTAVATTLEEWRRGFDQLFVSAMAATTALVPNMRKQGFGRIITITSLSVVEPIDHLVVSTAMRSAITGFMKTLASEVAAFGVTVNTVMPGVIHTGRIEALRRAKAARDGSTLEAELAATARQIPAGRLGRPEELADLVTFLASPRASYLTGASIAVDGGLRRSL